MTKQKTALNTHQSNPFKPKITNWPFPADFQPKSVANWRHSVPLVLVILDGWGIGPDYDGNAVKLAKTPNLDRMWQMYPHTQLGASGESVGLPKGVDGNSEVGHTNIGAGSIILQDLPRINQAIADGSFAKNQAFLKTFSHVKKHHSALHLIGLVGDGFVHSSVDHLYALLALAKEHDLTQVYVHVITDGRDSPPYVGVDTVVRLEQRIKQIGVGQIASVMGRFYAMDRDQQWDRVAQAYHTLVVGSSQCVADVKQYLKDQYQQKITDEYIKPANVCLPGQSRARLIQDNDGVIFFNFRVDRPRELTAAFVIPHAKFKSGFNRKKQLKNLFFTTMTTYAKDLPVSAVAFDKLKVKENVGHTLSRYGIRQLRLAETEKERMVTYYMNGQNYAGYPGEKWVIFPSKGARSYADVPEMSAHEITNYLINATKKNDYDVAIVNLANGDMVGHTGDLKAGIKACEVVDRLVGEIEQAVLEAGGWLLVTADHGNVEEMKNIKTGEVDTKHSTFPVPFIIASQKTQGQNLVLPKGVLADVVPTVLYLLHLKQPKAMTGRNLFVVS